MRLKGVYKEKRTGRRTAYIGGYGKRQHLGCFATEIEAGKYRKRADTPDAHREAQQLAGQMALPEQEQTP